MPDTPRASRTHEYTKDEALTFIESLRLMLSNRTGFKWLAEKLSLLAAYIESTAKENELLNDYLDSTNTRGDYESYREAHPQPTDHGGADSPAN